MKRNTTLGGDVFGENLTLLVIILNYNGLPDTLECLDSLEAQTARNFDVLVIDNASTLNEASVIRMHSLKPGIIELSENRGWAGGNNVGLKVFLEGEYGLACLLNNDTTLRPNALEELENAARVLGPCLLHPAIYYFESPETAQLNPVLRAKSGPDVEHLSNVYDIVEMDYAYGACLLLHGEVVRRVGLFDERFFLQLEEADYHARARRFGIRAFCARRAVVLHKESASFGGRISPEKTYYIVRNSFLFAEKHNRSASGFVQTARKILWSLRHTANASRTANQGALRFGAWLLSQDSFAGAARQGFSDYVRRRFGPRRHCKPSRS